MLGGDQTGYCITTGSGCSVTYVWVTPCCRARPAPGFAGGGFLASDRDDDRRVDGDDGRGSLVHTMAHGLQPYAMLGRGCGHDRQLVRPVLRFGLGVDVPLSRAFALGPVLGYGQVFQTDKRHRLDRCALSVGRDRVAYRPCRARAGAAPNRGSALMPPPERATAPSKGPSSSCWS